MICGRFNLQIICKLCLANIHIYPNKRVLKDNFIVYSFFKYDQVGFLLKSKYYIIGSRIYKTLANKANNYLKSILDSSMDNVYSIGIDDRIKHYYSHTGVILQSFKHIAKPIFGALTSDNNIKYAGCDLKFRKNNKKNFKYNGKRNINAILVDDIITTGSSIMQAKEVLQANNVRVLFAVVLSDADNTI